MNKPEVDRSQRKALGKGLSALLPGKNGPVSKPPQPAEPPAAVAAAAAPAHVLPENFEEFESIALDRLLPNEDQPRNSFDGEKMQELARSIRAHGIIQPITVIKGDGDRYRVVAGERRWRAAQLAGLTEIPALVRTIPKDKLLELALIENIQREDLNPIETALAFAKLINEHRLSHEQVAERTGKERSTVSNFLRLLRLAPELQEQVIQGNLTMGHARALLALPTALQQKQVARQILEKKLSVREAERLVKLLTEPQGETVSKLKSEPPRVDPNVRAALDQLQSVLGTKVRLVPRTPTSGRLEIEYYSQDDLDRIYGLIVSEP